MGNKSGYAFTLAQARKCVYPYPIYEAHFSDGTVQRLTFWQSVKGSWDFDRARHFQSLTRHGRRREIIDGYLFHGDKNRETPFTVYRDPAFTGRSFYRGAIEAVIEKRKPRITAAQLKAVLRGVLDGDETAINEAQALIAA